jgi:PAS domain S-box-containing protein
MEGVLMKKSFFSSPLLALLLPLFIALIFAVAYLFGGGVVTRSGERIEQDSLRESVEGVGSALAQETERIDLSLRDWAYWDSTYDFLMTGAKKAIEGNLGVGNLKTLDLAYLVAMKSDGTPVYTVGYDSEPDIQVPVPEELLAASSPAIEPVLKGERDSLTGILALKKEVILFACRNILHSDNSGPSAGVMLMARRIDSALTDKFGKLLHISVAIDTFDEASGRPDEKAFAGELAAGAQPRIQYLDDSRARIYAAVNGLDGKPAGFLRIEKDRPIHTQVRVSLKSLLFWDAITALIAVVLSEIFIAFNMLNYKRRLEAERRYGRLLETSPDGVINCTLEGKIVFANAKSAEILRLEDPTGLPGKSLKDFVLDENWRLYTARIAELSVGGSVPSFEVAMRRGGEEDFFAEVSAALVGADKEGSKTVLLIFRDVTERKAYVAKIEGFTTRLKMIAAAGAAGNIESLVDKDSLADLVARSAEAVYPGSSSFLWLASEPDNRLYLAGSSVKGYDAIAAKGLEARPEHKLIEEAFRTGKPAFSREGISAFVIPLKSKDGIFGVIEFVSQDMKVLDGTDEDTANVFVDLLSVAFSNERLFDETKERLMRLESLRTIDKAISSSFDLSFVLAIILEQAKERLDVDAACILLYDGSADVLKFAANIGFLSDALRHTRLRPGEGLAGKVLADRNLIVVKDLADSPTDFLRSPGFSSEGFRFYGGMPLLAKGKALGVLEVYKRSPFDPQFSWKGFLETISDQAAIAIDNAALFEDLEKANDMLRGSYEATIESWAEALELRDRETEGHCRRVSDMTLRLAERMGLEGKILDDIRHGSLLHDIGKIGIPDSILLKPGTLTVEEFEVIKGHCLIARDFLSRIPLFSGAVAIPYSHHEKWDGTGYPLGLKGEDIPFPARIFAIIDVWDALSSDRPYRKAWSKEEIKAHILSLRGTHFDPKVVDAFMALLGALPDDARRLGGQKKLHEQDTRFMA